jgi:hypothetical protein
MQRKASFPRPGQTVIFHPSQKCGPSFLLGSFARSCQGISSTPHSHLTGVIVYEVLQRSTILLEWEKFLRTLASGQDRAVMLRSWMNAQVPRHRVSSHNKGRGRFRAECKGFRTISLSLVRVHVAKLFCTMYGDQCTPNIRQTRPLDFHRRLRNSRLNS